MYWGHRRLMLPWLFLQGFLASILAALVRFIYTFFSFYFSYSKMVAQKDFRINSESIQNQFRINSESIQNAFRIVSELFDKAMTKQEDLKVCWDAEKIIYIFEFCTVLPILSVLSYCETVTQILNSVV